jgi:hypothetical protein
VYSFKKDSFPIIVYRFQKIECFFLYEFIKVKTIKKCYKINKIMSEIHFSDEQENTLRILRMSFSAISLVGCSFIICSYWFFKENRSFNTELIVWYTIADALYSISTFFPYDPIDKPIWCGAQSIFDTIFITSCQIWGCIMGYVAFISAIKKDHIEKYKCFYRGIFLFMSYAVPFLLSTM